ncbi:MAG: hypothetical protein WD016_13970 [Balneolaceae bacterium]
MGSPRKVKDIKASLTTKGFTESEGKNHTKYLYKNKNLKEPLFTIISRGSKEYDISLLDKMANQLNLTNKQLLNFVDCPLTAEKYLSIQIERGVIKKVKSKKDKTSN